MAASLDSDMKVYDNYAAGRTNELLAQFGDVFNGASNGAIKLSTKTAKGNYAYESFFANLGATLASRRDNTSVSAQTDTALTQGEHVMVKLSRKINTVATTRDAWLKAFGSISQAEFSDVLGEQVANIMQLEMVNTVLLACRAALKQQSTSYVTDASLGSMTTNMLVSMLEAMGDRANRIVCWVMHSSAYYDLVRNQIGANITNISDFNIATASPVTLNRPVIITDSSALVTQINSPDLNNYFTLGLTAGAIEVENSEEQYITFQEITGLENLIIRMQGEYAYTVGLKGFKYDVTSGGANPDATAVALGTNWDTHYTSVKDRAGICGMTL
jgi:hypothetical protein